MLNGKVYQKLAAIQTALKAPKSQFNKFGGYKYRKAEDILEAVKPLLKEHGCALTCSDDLQQIGDRYYIKATAMLICAEDGSYQSCEAYAREEEEKKGMDGSQVTGASSSYARKYALNGLLCIDD
ncbi:MAG: ERF family protein, partial [Clostridia bacterium]|nr:ERF family protein [Clostridia bacterium]